MADEVLADEVKKFIEKKVDECLGKGRPDLNGKYWAYREVEKAIRDRTLNEGPLTFDMMMEVAASIIRRRHDDYADSIRNAAIVFASELQRTAKQLSYELRLNVSSQLKDLAFSLENRRRMNNMAFGVRSRGGSTKGLIWAGIAGLVMALGFILLDYLTK